MSAADWAKQKHKMRPSSVSATTPTQPIASTPGLLTAEIGYVDLGNYRGTIPTIEGPASTRVDLDGFSVGLRPQFALNDDWFAQAQIGAFLWEADASVRTPLGNFRTEEHGEDPCYGIGIGRSFGPSWQAF